MSKHRHHWWNRPLTYEEKFRRFCEQWHLDPEDPQSAVEYELWVEYGGDDKLGT